MAYAQCSVVCNASGMSWVPVCGKLWVLMWRHGRGPGPWCPGGLWFSDMDLSSLTPFIQAPTVTMINEASFSSSFIILEYYVEAGVRWPLPCVISPPGSAVQCRVQVCRPVKQRHLLWAGPLAVVTSPCPGPATAQAQCAARLRAEHTCGQWQHIITDKYNNSQWPSGLWINVCMSKTWKWVKYIKWQLSAESELLWLHWRAPRWSRVSGEDELMMSWWHNHQWLGA